MFGQKEVYIVGGPNGSEETIRRRYLRSRGNFWYNYKDMAHNWYLFDNSGKIPDLVANSLSKDLRVVKQEYFGFFVKSVERR